MSVSSRWHPTRVVRISTVVALAVAGAVLVWVAVAKPSTPGSAAAAPPGEHATASAAPTSSPTPARSSARGDQTDVRDKVTGLVLPESHPEALSIPRIGVHSRLVDLGLGDKGAMDTPNDPAVAGWFDRGPTPGALGPAVIAGHVTWGGSAIFYRLGTLRPGDQVNVTRKDGRTAVFTVTRVARFSKSRFPSQQVYGAIDHAGLRLITCGGTYDSARRRYLDNVVVFARLAAVRGPS